MSATIRQHFLITVGLTLCWVASAQGWQMRVAANGTPEVFFNGARVLTATPVFWGPAWKFAGSNFSARPREGGGYDLSGIVRDLDLTFEGSITRAQPGALRWGLTLTAGRNLEGIIGGGFEFDLALTSDAFGGKAGDPVLLEGNRGIRWPARPGQEVRVEFSQPVSNVYFERGNKAQIRVMVVGATLAAGPRPLVMTVALPEGGTIIPSLNERWGTPDTSGWYKDALPWDLSPVDLRFLNDDQRPAGKHGPVRAEGDRLVFADGTPARFWGGNIAAYAIFSDKDAARQQAQRIAKLGYNLMRIHHHDSTGWVNPTVIDKSRADTQELDAQGMDRLDWLVKCLKDEGVYVWLDLHVGRLLKPGDNLGAGAEEILKRGGEMKGFCYYSERLQELMRQFNREYLGHVNPYTGLAYKDDPAVMGLLITNENELTNHFGNLMLGDKGNPVFNRIFLDKVKEFCARTGLPADRVGMTWLPGPSKIFLANQEHLFNQSLLGDLAQLGVRVPVATTQSWGGMPVNGLPSLTDGGIIDVHSYGEEEDLSANPHTSANFASWIAAAQVYGKPLACTEWNVPYPARDRFLYPLYVAGLAALQGWDAPMIYNYSQSAFRKPGRPETWSTYFDPALTALIPAAALLYRQGHVSEARETYCLNLSRADFFDRVTSPATSAAIRTLCERSKLTLGIPATPELPWLQPTVPEPETKVVTDPAQDFIPPDQGYVESDTGQLRRDWGQGVWTVDTPLTQAAVGWLGGKRVTVGQITVEVSNPAAAVAFSSLDGKPLRESRRVLLTVVARAVGAPQGSGAVFLSEPVTGTVSLKSDVTGLKLAALSGDGTPSQVGSLRAEGGVYSLALPVAGGTHWFLLSAE